MADYSSFNDQENSSKEKNQNSFNENKLEEQDFFEQLKRKEKQKGTSARGGGHRWTTFIETLLGDW